MRAALVERILDDPAAAIAHGRSNLVRLRAADTEGHAVALLDAWDRLLEGPIEAIVATLTDPDAEQLASSSPFAGLLRPTERWDILRRIRATVSCDSPPREPESSDAT